MNDPNGYEWISESIHDKAVKKVIFTAYIY